MISRPSTRYSFSLCDKVTFNGKTLSCRDELGDKELEHVFRLLVKDVCFGGHKIYRACLSSIDEEFQRFFSAKVFNACCLTYLKNCEGRIRILEVLAEAFDSREKFLKREARISSINPIIIDALLEDDSYVAMIKKRKLAENDDQTSD